MNESLTEKGLGYSCTAYRGDLCTASQGDYDKCVQLIEQGHDVNERSWGDTDCATPIMLAAFRGQHGIVNLLMEHGADINAVAIYRETALLLASRNSPLICPLLIHHGADVNATDHLGQTPLHHACEFKDETLCNTLIDNGAHLFARCSSGRTPLDCVNQETGRLNKHDLIARSHRRMHDKCMAFVSICSSSSSADDDSSSSSSYLCLPFDLVEMVVLQVAHDMMQK
jgi:Ankyrin repeats (3 copies)/Ankyrin repeat